MNVHKHELLLNLILMKPLLGSGSVTVCILTQQTVQTKSFFLFSLSSMVVEGQ